MTTSKQKVAEEHGLIDASQELDSLAHVSVCTVSVEPTPSLVLELDSREFVVLQGLSRVFDTYGLFVDTVEGENPSRVKVVSQSKASVRSI